MPLFTLLLLLFCVSLSKSLRFYKNPSPARVRGLSVCTAVDQPTTVEGAVGSEETPEIASIGAVALASLPDPDPSTSDRYPPTPKLRECFAFALPALGIYGENHSTFHPTPIDKN